MKTFYVLAAICIVGAYAENSGLRDFNIAAEQCAEQTDVSLEIVDIRMFEKIKAGKLKPTEELYCFTACMIEKVKESEDTIHDFIMEALASAEKRGFFNNKDYSREDLENVANKCARKDLSDCDYLKCIKILEAPFLHLR